jgi:ubiquinone/menaquinone biosynthesis C-methylase UbiE
VARKRIKGVVFGQADMVNLNLGKRFDVVLCLFSSIGYVRTYANLKKTLRNIARHLKTGGVVIIDPWRSKASFKTGSHLTTYDSESLKITVLALAKMRGNEGCRSAGDIFEKWPEDKSGFIRWDKEIATSLLESTGF